MARTVRLIRLFGFGAFSVGVHLAVGAWCGLLAASESGTMTPRPDWIEVDMESALGQPHGDENGKELGSHVPDPAPIEQFIPPEPVPALDPPNPPDPPDPTEPTDPVDPPDPVDQTEPVDPPDPPDPDEPDPEGIVPPDVPEPEVEPPADPPAPPNAPAPAASRKTKPNPDTAKGDTGDSKPTDSTASGGDPTTPVGTENVPPAVGSPDGVVGGKGTGPRRASPQYIAILTAWARARFPTHGHGLGPPPDGTRPCARVSVRVSPDRAVAGTSMGSSGQGAWDDKVRAGMQALNGATVPADPDGGPVPPSISISVCWE